MSTQSTHESIFKAVDDDEHLVFSEVYAPFKPDSDGDVMDAVTIKKMAHDFMKAQKLNQIDVQHNNELNPGASVVESFIARKDDPIFIEGAWVVGMHIPDDETWDKIKKGEINGFSIEALVTKTPMELELDIPPVVNGTTTKSEDHEHEFFVTFDAGGKFMGGRTSISKGHFHNIRAGTMTEVEQDHNHKFSFVESAFQNPMAVPAGLIAKESTTEQVEAQEIITTDVAQDTIEKDDSTAAFIASLNKEEATVEVTVETQVEAKAETCPNEPITNHPEINDGKDEKKKAKIKEIVEAVAKAQGKGVSLDEAIKAALLVLAE